jgi:hypothetical protein
VKGAGIEHLSQKSADELLFVRGWQRLGQPPNNQLVLVPPSPPAYWNQGVRRKFPPRSLILNDLQIKSLRTNDLAAILLLLVVKGCPKTGLGWLPWPRHTYLQTTCADVHARCSQCDLQFTFFPGMEKARPVGNALYFTLYIQNTKLKGGGWTNFGTLYLEHYHRVRRIL